MEDIVMYLSYGDIPKSPVTATTYFLLGCCMHDMLQRREGGREGDWHGMGVAVPTTLRRFCI